MAVGGGVGGLVVLLIALFTGMDPSALLQEDPGTQQGGGGALEDCETGADIDTNPECRFVAVQNSIEDFWEYEFAEAGSQYEPATFTAFTGSVSTGCGSASSQVGPFYCPPDQGVYLDLGFFETMKTQLGAEGGDFAEAYVVAHEYGHHVQNLTGQMDRVRTQQGPDSDAVRLELQADCLAGMWSRFATEVPGADGEILIQELTQQDVEEALDAARAVGDDRIQQRTSGRVDPDAWTHGSAEQRMKWFTRGREQGNLRACDTFSVGSL